MNDLALAVSMGRAVGKTHELAELCKSKGWTLICANQREAERIAKHHGCKTVDLQRSFRGTTGPYLADHLAIEGELSRLEKELDKLRAEVYALQRALYGRARGSKASLLPDVANALLAKQAGEGS